VRIQCPENLRVPSLGSSMEGESGPKARSKDVVDGKQGNIPVLIMVCTEGRSRHLYTRVGSGERRSR
jgi:hypothetical protein